ncbi:hypothetical protein NDI38_27410 [Stenomitos frigidus AS-A4]|uniref:Uncharacterized protein n=1 Tax=Stenomitos frigidus AS-A4 TaxID=2933935 RepID=A0ABV0KS91_9CYAN|nr:hypothetical protein [Phormidium sp. FACHB-592]
MFRFHQLNRNKRSPPAFPKNLSTFDSTHTRLESWSILPSFVIIKLQLQQKQSGYNPTSIPLLWAIALNGNMNHLLERLLAIGFTVEGWLTRKGRSPYSSALKRH